MAKKHKTYKVMITETAWEKLIYHARFLANVSVPAANRLIDDFIEISNSLTTIPERNPWLDHDEIPFQKYRKLLFGKHDMALYQVQDNIVYITSVLDCRQDYHWLL